MEKRVLVLVLCALLFVGCVEETQEEKSEELSSVTVVTPEHTHTIAEEADNVVPHESVGYCGNMITTVRRCDGSEPWERSFYGSRSVELSDLLKYLDYSGEVCPCAGEYTVETELDEEAYTINLTEGFVRHGDGQVSLTEAQVLEIGDIMDGLRNINDGGILD